MSSKWEAFRGSAGFYGTMAVCLLVVGVGGYFLLFDNKTADTDTISVTEEPVLETVATTPTPEVEEEPTEAEPTVVETIAPEPVQTVSMPEIEVDDTPVAAEAPRLIVSPVSGNVLAAFSVDQLAYDPTMEDWRIHDGVDIAAKPGTTVLAASSGTVLSVEDDALMGTTVVISHDGGYQTTYANLQAQPTVTVGDSVSAGQIIGAVGSTAAAESAQSPHLHFSVAKDGDVVDPEEFLGNH
jgi:murein DD-endopeptidase MepM/ murein hydrolase activator NlpD